MRRTAGASRWAPVVLGAALLAACSGGRSVEPVAPDVVAEQIASALEKKVGVRPVVTCPEELAAEVGADVVCDLTTEADPETIYPVTATVTSVNPDTGEVKFDVTVANAPAGSEGPTSSTEPSATGEATG